MAENRDAQRIVLEVDADYSGAIQGAKNYNKEIDKSPLKNIKTQIREATNEMQKLALAGKENSREFQQLASRIAELRDTQQQLNRTVEAFNPDNRFTAVSKIAGLAANSVGALQGSFVLMGISADTANESIAKLQSIQAIIGLIDNFKDASDFLKPFLQRLGLAKTATSALTTVTEAQTVATRGADVATKGLGIGLKALGIGLIVSAIAYLVANFDEIKKSVLKLLPSLNESGETFNKVKNIVVGVGNAIIQFVIAPIKSAIKLLSGDFKGALAEFKKGADVINNFKAGQDIGEKNDAEARRKESLERAVKSTEDRIAILKAEGKETTRLERDNLNRRLELAKDDAEKKKEVLQEQAVFEAGLRKKANDDILAKHKEADAKAKQAQERAKADREAKVKELEKYNDDAKKIIRDGNSNERTKELNALDAKYKAEIDLAKQLGKATTDLETAKGIEKVAINKKYDDIIFAYTNSLNDVALNEFDRRRQQINKEADDLLKNATPSQASAINGVRIKLLGQNSSLQTASDASNGANSDLKNAEFENRENPNDTPEQATAKITALAQARLLAENSAFELKKLQLVGQNTELQRLKSEHENSLVKIQEDALVAKKAIDDAEKENKLKLYSALGEGATQMGAIIGEQTVAGKALAVAGALISTYSAIAGQLSAFSKVPIPGYAIAQSIITGLAGFASVRNILKVKVPNAGGATAGATVSPPTINSTILKRNENGSTEIKNSIENKNAEPTRAYVVDKDLRTQEAKNNFNKSISTF